MIMMMETNTAVVPQQAIPPQPATTPPTPPVMTRPDEEQSSPSSPASSSLLSPKMNAGDQSATSPSSHPEVAPLSPATSPHPHPLHHSPSSSPSFHTQNIPGNLSPSNRLHPHPSEQSIVTDEVPCNDEPTFETSSGHAQHYTPTPPPPEGLERIGKLFGSSPGSEEDGLANASQLLAAAVAAATVAASGNLAALSPQEQWLASMAPTLLHMITGGAGGVGGGQPANQDTGSSPDASGDDDDSNDQSMASSSVGKRRKQSKPVRYQDEPGGLHFMSPFESVLEQAAAARKAAATLASTAAGAVSKSSVGKRAQFGSSLSDAEHDEDDEDDDDDDEEEEEEHRRQGDAQGEPSSEEDEDGNQVTERSRLACDKSSTTPLLVAESAAVPVEGTVALTGSSPAEDDEVLREKQQQLLANMFANLQEKLIHSVFCPQCNCPFPNEDSLRAHIEIEHMQKLNFFSEAAAAAAAAAAANNSPDALHLKQIAEMHLAMQAKLQEQFHHEAAQRLASSKRKRKLNRSPSSRSVSSVSSLDSADSPSPGQKELLDREDGLEGGGGSPSHHQAKSRKRSSKDLNHNLLQSLNHLAPNLISPLISSLNGSKPPAGGPHSPHSLLQQHQQQQQARLLSGSPPGAGAPEQISPSTGEHHRLSPSSNPAAALASMIPGLSPYFFNNFMSQSGGSVVHPNGQVQFREHLQGQQQGHPFGPAGGLPSSHHPSSAISLNGGAPPAGGHPSNTSAAAAAAAAASLRIFNPEAYCELCNKEFCNKYFLKTHKANKHGIYTPDSGERGNSNSSSSEDQRQRPLGQSASSGQAGSPVHHLPPTSNSLAALMGGTPTSNGHNTITTTTTNNSSSSLKASPSSQQQAPHGAPLPGDFGGHSPNQPGLIPGFPGGPMRLNLNLNMINLDSYCEICQKEFCNKYFLKKHKQKIHGYIYQGDTAIPPPNIAAQFVAASQQPNHPAQLQQLQQLQMLQQQLVAQQSQQQQQQQQQQYRRSPDPRGASECKSGASPPPPTSQSANQLSVITSAASLTHADKSQNSSESFSPAPGAIAPEKLHSLGVINADAFCEICCKEFCNKYFLRTHKVNKHGLHDGVSIAGKFAPNSLLVNSERHSAAPGGAGEMTPSFGGLFPSPNGASSPANGSAASQASGDDTGLEPGQRDPATYGKNGGDFLLGFASATGAAKCALCPAHFPSTYLMNMHKAYVHNIPYGSLNGQKQENGTKEEIKSEEIDGEPKETKYDPSSVDSDVETEVSHVAPSFLVSAELNQDSSQHSMVSNRSKDGQDLAKLHSMIRGLMPGEEVAEDGAISRNGRGDEPKIACHICKYELENRYYLRAHLINEHGFPPTEEAFLQMLNATSGMNFLTEQQAKEQLQKASSLGPQGPGSSEAYCEICNKEFCSKYFLKTHKQKIHNIVDGSSPSGSQNGALEGPPQSLFSSLYQAAALQQQHAQSAKSQGAKYASSSPSANPNIQATIKAALAAGLVPNSEPATPTGPPKGPTNGLRAPVMTGRNYCNICNKELCNKYFMKTHMLKMHNINIDEHPFEAQQSSTIGGVTCDICQKELCSKYFLKVHKQNTHGIYEDGSAPPVLLGASGSPGFPGAREAGGGRSGGGRGRNSNANVNPMLHPGVNGPGQIVPEGLGGLNPMLFMSMIQNAAAQAASQAAAAAAADSSDSNSVCSSNSERDAKLHGLDPVTDAGHRLFASFQESCQLCERRFKSMKWLKAHMMNDHGEVLQMMRTSGEIVQAFAQSTGANAESLARMCFVCGQTFNDRLAATIHLVKEHKMTSEDLALNLPSNFKMLAIMAAAAAAAQQNGSNGPDGQSGASDLSLARDESPLSRRTPLSRSSTPSSPKPDDRMLNGSHHLLANPAAALQHLLLAKQSGLNPMALLAAQGGNPWAMAGMMDFAGGTAEEAQLQLQQAQQQQQSQQPASQQVSPFPFTVNSRPTGHGNTKNPPGKFVCSQCFRTYRHSHSLQRHILATHKKNQTPGGQQQQPQQPPTAASSAPTAQSVTAPLGPLVPVTPSLDTKLDQNGTPAGGPNQKPRNKRYRCSKCNKKFRTRELCLVHIRALHSIAPTTPKLSADPLSMSIAPSTPESSSRIIFTSPNSALARNGAVASTHTEADLPLALTLGSSPRSTPEPPVSGGEASSHHQLPPSPSASSEDDLLNGHHHPHNPKAHLPSLTRSQAYLPQSPLEDEEEENAGAEGRDLSAKERADSLAAKILNLSHAGDAKDCTEASSPASPSSSLHARPSLICVNGEKF